ncbi:ectoine/hydroxyectoine ABC transporter substrate-binding protein EhuB [Quadrisphaera sp. GCM10027208]|uniref:ectoine/hydroxyectoine ABC transporter substrate-binding protein EhuB n=1 Tax=Quadrisphaera sp. GCM10027208 TaxID=3273423 RepID=UPI0036164489
MMSARTRRRGVMAVTGGALALVLAACGDGGDGNGTAEGGEGRLAELQEAGTITVGFAGEAPYSFMNDEGELVGASVALQERIWGELGIDNIEGVQAEFGQLIQGLNAGRFDIVAAGMSILPDRCEQALFSDPEFQYTTALLVEAGNPHGLTNMQSIAESDVTMAAMRGAIEADYANDLGIEPVLVGDPQDGMDAVTSGRADVFALTGISLNWMVENSGTDAVEVTDSFVAEIDGVKQYGAGGTVFRQEDEELRDAYNEHLADIVGDEETYLDVVGEWGFTAEERPTGEFTTEELCAGEIG